VEVEREVQVEVEVEVFRCTSETISRCTSETFLRCTSEAHAYIIYYDIYIYNLCACAHLYTNDFSQSCSSTILCKYFAAVDLLPELHLLHEGRWCHFLWPEIECPSTTSPSNYPLFQSNPTGNSPREAIPNWPLTCCNNRTENKKNVG